MTADVGPEGQSDSSVLQYTTPATQRSSSQAPLSRLDFVVVLIRLVSLYYIVTNGFGSVFLGITVVRYRTPSDPFTYREIAFLATVGGLIAAMCFWIVAPGLGRFILRDVPQLQLDDLPDHAARANHLRRPLDSIRLMAMCISLMGVLLLAYAMRHVPVVLSDMQADTPRRLPVVATESSERLTQFLTEVAVGLLLFRFGPRLSLWWHRRGNADRSVRD